MPLTGLAALHVAILAYGVLVAWQCTATCQPKHDDAKAPGRSVPVFTAAACGTCPCSSRCCLPVHQSWTMCHSTSRMHHSLTALTQCTHWCQTECPYHTNTPPASPAGKLVSLIQPSILPGDNTMADLHLVLAAVRALRDKAPELLPDAVWVDIDKAISGIEAGFDQVVVKHGLMAPEGVDLKVSGAYASAAAYTWLHGCMLKKSPWPAAL